MTALTQTVSDAWESREGPVVFSTAAADGTPNAVYMTCVKKTADDAIVLVDNFFTKTRANVTAGSVGSLLFITADGKSYQIKGSLEYLTDGAVYDDMKTWNPDTLPGVAAVVLHVEKVYSGAKQLA